MMAMSVHAVTEVTAAASHCFAAVIYKHCCLHWGSHGNSWGSCGHSGDPMATVGDCMARVASMFQGRSRDWTRLAEDTKGGRSRAATPKGGEGRGVLDEPGAGEAIIGARVGIFWEDDETFYKASSNVVLCCSAMVCSSFDK